jgi:hypothetical protein
MKSWILDICFFFGAACDELMLGLPVFTWWVGITALLCIVLALLAPVVLPLHKLFNNYEGTDLSKTDAAKRHKLFNNYEGS